MHHDRLSFSIIILNLTSKDVKALSFLRKGVADEFKTMGVRMINLKKFLFRPDLRAVDLE